MQERIDGLLYLMHGGVSLRYRKVSEAPRAETKKKAVTRKQIHLPQPMEHPWKALSYRQMLAQKAAVLAA